MVMLLLVEGKFVFFFPWIKHQYTKTYGVVETGLPQSIGIRQR